MKFTIFGITLSSNKERERIRKLEAKLYVAEQTLEDVAYLTYGDRVGSTLEHKEAVIETVHHHALDYLNRSKA